MIKLQNLTFTYAGSPEPVLKEINLTITDGEFVLLSGSSGSGKSSLVRCLNGLIPHFYGGQVRGTVEVEGLVTTNHALAQLATLVGLVFQDPENQLVTTDVEREIAFGLENLGLPRAEISKRLEEALDTVGISSLRCRSLHELSGGEKQKVAIASVLALKPQILVLDEPTSELDPQGAEDVLGIISRLNDELGLTVILVEHRLDRVIHLVDRLIVLDQGRIVADGQPSKIMRAEYEKLDNIGFGFPPLVFLAQKLIKTGHQVNGLPLTVKQARTTLEAFFRAVESPPPRVNKKPYGIPVIEVEKLWFSYHKEPMVLKGIDLRLYQGEFIAVMGRNASGKTTLVKHFNGLLKPGKGKVLVNGQDIKKTTVAELARQVGYVFQNPNDHLFADTVEEEIAFTLKSLGFENIASRVNNALQRFNLAPYKKQYPRFLSGGEKQRVALASVLVAEPKVLILDEPTRGMDNALKTSLMQFLKEYRQQGHTVIVVTHDVEMAAAHAERIILLSEGKVVVDGHKKEVLSRALLFSPQINRVLQGFEKYGVPQDILTVEEALNLIKGGREWLC
ncbi:MAG TPA: ABC transporter [Desulfotomaculum sp.]|nr:ABC transporter [Desulfotomaculum sp.]